MCEFNLVFNQRSSRFVIECDSGECLTTLEFIEPKRMLKAPGESRVSSLINEPFRGPTKEDVLNKVLEWARDNISPDVEIRESD